MLKDVSKQMKTCPNCKVVLTENCNFCTNCGTSLLSQNSIPDQTPINNPFSRNKRNYSYPFNIPYLKSPPIGIALIVLYECLFGLILIFFGLDLFSLLGNNYTSLTGNSPVSAITGFIISNGWILGIMGIIGSILLFLNQIFGPALSLTFLKLPLFSLLGNNYTSLIGNPEDLYIIGGLIAICWGILGIIGGVLLFRGYIVGFVLSLIFLLSTGLILLLFIIPTVVMIISCIYFVLDKKIRNFLKRNEIKVSN